MAQLVEHRTGNREVTGSNPVEVLNFFQASLHNCINCVHCDDHFFIFISFPQFIYDLFHTSLAKKVLLYNGWYNLKLGKNMPRNFESVSINEALNICRYLKNVSTYKKIIDIFLKFHHYLLRMRKIIEIGWLVHSKKRESKTYPTRI